MRKTLVHLIVAVLVCTVPATLASAQDGGDDMKMNMPGESNPCRECPERNKTSRACNLTRWSNHCCSTPRRAPMPSPTPLPPPCS